MLKQLLSLGFFLTSVAVSGQVQSGSLVESGRNCLTQNPVFTLESSSTEGVIVVELAVNRDGKVTGTKIIGEQSTLNSTPMMMKVQNAAKKLTFTAGTRYAAFEHVRIKYTIKKKPL
jgi:uncharacterized protein YuzE